MHQRKNKKAKAAQLSPAGIKSIANSLYEQRKTADCYTTETDELLIPALPTSQETSSINLLMLMHQRMNEEPKQLSWLQVSKALQTVYMNSKKLMVILTAETDELLIPAMSTNPETSTASINLHLDTSKDK
jgi:hypothetical protein